jgi:uncharacterized protein (TIGR00255 family)
MIKSMTGFGGRQAKIDSWGKVSVELRSANHKFLEVVFHLPEGFLSLEDRIKREVESKIKRGRVTCAINIVGAKGSRAYVNKELIQAYSRLLTDVKRQFHIKDELSINTLVHLPGVLSLGENKSPETSIWPKLKALINAALDDLIRMRQKEGRSLFSFMKKRAESLARNLFYIKRRFRDAIRDKLSFIKTDEERSVFLKDTDITEEIERLGFHIRNFKNKLSKKGAIGKELDFIAQEMQREANTMGAKSFDVKVSARVLQLKSQIEKIREQAQNIE